MPMEIDQGSPPPTIIALPDRRRANRREYFNPNLLVLLRRKSRSALSESAQGLELDVASDYSDRLAPSRGIGLGVLISIGIWGGVASVTWLFLHWNRLF